MEFENRLEYLQLKLSHINDAIAKLDENSIAAALLKVETVNVSAKLAWIDKNRKDQFSEESKSSQTHRKRNRVPLRPADPTKSVFLQQFLSRGHPQ